MTNDYYQKQVLRKTVALEYQTYRISECSIYLCKNCDIKSGEKNQLPGPYISETLVENGLKEIWMGPPHNEIP